MMEQKGETGMKKSGKLNTGAGKAIAAGSLLTIIMLLTEMAILSKTMLSGKVGENSVAVLIPVMLAISVFIGSWLTTILSQEGKIAKAVITGGLLLFVLIVACMVMEGPLRSAPSRIGAIGIGVLSSCVLCMKKGKKHVGRQRRYR